MSEKKIDIFEKRFGISADRFTTAHEIIEYVEKRLGKKLPFGLAYTDGTFIVDEGIDVEKLMGKIIGF
jgi:hypothetical protein